MHIDADADWCRLMHAGCWLMLILWHNILAWRTFDLWNIRRKLHRQYSFQLCRWGHLGKLQRWKGRDQGVSYQSKLAEDCCNQDTYAEQHRLGHAELQNIPLCTEKCHLDAIPTIEGNPAAIARPMYTQCRGQHSHRGGGILHPITHNPPS